MESPESLVLPKSSCPFDNCLVLSFLKTRFSKSREGKNIPDITIKNTIADAKSSLERIYSNSPVELSYDYLSAMEQSLPSVAFRYAVIHRNDVPVLFVYFQLYVVTSQNFNLEKNKKFVRGILRFFLDVKKARVLMSGNALRTETQSYSFDARVFTQLEAMEAIASIAEKIAADEHVTAVVLKDFDGMPAESRRMLPGMGYRTPLEDKIMEMAIDSEWRSLADYTAVLGRKYKTRAKKAVSAIKNLTVQPLTEEQLQLHEAEISQLYAQLVHKQSFVLTHTAPGYFTSLKKLYKDDFEATGFFLDGRLIAFYSAFLTPDTYEIHYAGYDNTHNNDYQLYFNILFSGLERAILLKKKQLKLGRTSFDAKASLGAQPKKLDYSLKLANIPDFVVKWFVSYFSSLEDGKWKLRNPLKGSDMNVAEAI